MICIHRLVYLMSGWYLFRKGDKPHLIVSAHIDIDEAIFMAENLIEGVGVDRLSTMEELLQELEHRCQMAEE